MNKCHLYIDLVNSENFDEKDKSYTDALAHSDSCADCSCDRKLRDSMLLSLKKMPEPAYPQDLHQLILDAALDKKSSISEETDFISSIINKVLRPIEILAPVACIFMVFSMLSLNSSNDESYQIAEAGLEQQLEPDPVEVAANNEVLNSDPLPQISKDEIREFLAKLDDFQKTHPESNRRSFKNRPDVRLVVDR